MTIEATAIPAPPPELWDWLEEIVRSLFANCGNASPEAALAAVHNPGPKQRLEISRGMRQRFHAEGREDEWRRHGRGWLRDAYREGRSFDDHDVAELRAA